jgi:hypothetical protein
MTEAAGSPEVPTAQAHVAIVRLARKEASKAPRVAATLELGNSKTLTPDAAGNGVLDLAALLAKRFVSVGYLLGRDGSMGHSRTVCTALNLLCCLQVSAVGVLVYQGGCMRPWVLGLAPFHTISQRSPLALLFLSASHAGAIALPTLPTCILCCPLFLCVATGILLGYHSRHALGGPVGDGADCGRARCTLRTERQGRR